MARTAILVFLVFLVSASSALTSWSHGSAAHAATGDFPIGSSAQSIESGGLTRTYRMYVPDDLPPNAPLVVMLHGGGGSGEIAERFYGWDRLAERQKFIVAYPDGLGPAIPAWNVDGGDCCGYPRREQIDDVQFIKDMVAEIETRASIDPNRVFASGISNGGIMAYTLACETTLFAAIGPVSATMLNSCDQPEPVSVIHIHGLKDEAIQFDGGPGHPPGNIDGPPIPDVIARWQSVDDCQPPTSTTEGVVTTESADCADGRAVELITISDAEHGWPGAPAKSKDSTSGGKTPSQAIDSTTTIWSFFEAHPRP
jgi:polyhydroxybutyrate depolymerase